MQTAVVLEATGAIGKAIGAQLKCAQNAYGNLQIGLMDEKSLQFKWVTEKFPLSRVTSSMRFLPQSCGILIVSGVPAHTATPVHPAIPRNYYLGNARYVLPATVGSPPVVSHDALNA